MVAAAIIGGAIVGGVASSESSKSSAASTKGAAIRSSNAQIAAAEIAAEQQERAGERAEQQFRDSTTAGLESLSGFEPLKQAGLENLSFLTNEQEQFDFLQNNPLFQASLEEAQRQTLRQAGATGRLSAGDTLSALSQNVLLTAQPLISDRVATIQDLLTRGQTLAGSQANIQLGLGANLANLSTQTGNVQAASAVAQGQAAANRAAQIGAANAANAAAQGQAIQGVTQAIGTAAANNFFANNTTTNTGGAA